MKKLSFILSLILILTMIGSAGASAATILADEPEDTVIEAELTDQDAPKAVITPESPADAPSAEEIADLPGYVLVMGDAVLLTVERGEPALTSGEDAAYYTADFTFPGTEKRFCLVGLSADKVEEIQMKLIVSYVSGTDFDIDDLSFIDTEKTADSSSDDELCWAAGASNILTYTGWAAKAGFESTDDVFEAFIDAYDNKAGNAYYGVAWFFNGVNNFAVRNSAAASAAEGTGGYIADYAVEQVAGYEKMSAAGTAGMNKLYRRIEAGQGIALAVSLYASQRYAGAHTVTCWGFVEDESFDTDDPARYAGLFLTDSDSDILGGTDRRSSPNTLHAVSLSPYSEKEEYNGFSFMTRGYLAAVDECDWLLPYSEELPRETDEAALRDKVHTPDLCAPSMYLGVDTENPKVLLDLFESGVDFFFTPVILNMADVNYEGPVNIRINVTDENGRTIFTRTSKSAQTTLKPEKSASYGTKLVRLGGLPEGDYTMTITLNADRPVSEAYYYNNSISHRFSVRDSYLVGDANGDGSVDIMDVTSIQRMLARYEDNIPDRLAERLASDGEEVSIIDATLIQQYLAHYTLSRPFGEKKLYE